MKLRSRGQKYPAVGLPCSPMTLTSFPNRHSPRCPLTAMWWPASARDRHGQHCLRLGHGTEEWAILHNAQKGIRDLARVKNGADLLSVDGAKEPWTD